MSRPNDRISGGAASGTPTCPTCIHRTSNPSNAAWGWCTHPSNRVFAEGWPQGFTPSQSPDGTCTLHPARKAGDGEQGEKHE